MLVLKCCGLFYVCCCIFVENKVCRIFWERFVCKDRVE